MKFVLIEDDDDKLRKILDFLESEYPGVEVSVARSFASGLRAVISSQGKIDLVLLDMSFPNYDVSPAEPSGGNPEHFAGRELLAQMRLRGIDIPSIVITMFDSFGEKGSKMSLEQLKSELHQKYRPPYRDTVYYDSRQEGWRSALKESINRNTKGVLK